MLTADIMEILRVKKAHLPPPAPVVTTKKPKRKVTSAETVIEEASNVQASANESALAAGPSNSVATSSASSAQ